MKYSHFSNGQDNTNGISIGGASRLSNLYGEQTGIFPITRLPCADICSLENPGAHLMFWF